MKNLAIILLNFQDSETFQIIEIDETKVKLAGWSLGCSSETSGCNFTRRQTHDAPKRPAFDMFHGSYELFFGAKLGRSLGLDFQYEPRMFL